MVLLVNIKNLLFRFTAIILMVVTAGFVVLPPNSNVYSVDKTFIKSPAPMSENIVAIRADDGEDIDEYGAIGSLFFLGIISQSDFLIPFGENTNPQVKEIRVTSENPAYLTNRQLLI